MGIVHGGMVAGEGDFWQRKGVSGDTMDVWVGRIRRDGNEILRLRCTSLRIKCGGAESGSE